MSSEVDVCFTVEDCELEYNSNDLDKENRNGENFKKKRSDGLD